MTWPARAARLLHRHAAATVAIAGALTLAAALVARDLRVDADLARLLPPDYPSSRALARLQSTLGGENPLEVVITSPAFAANRAFAEALLPRVMERTDSAGRPFFLRAAYRRDVAFLERHALYLATDAELDSLGAFLRDLEVEGRRQANPLRVTATDTAERRLADQVARLEAAWRALVPGEFPISPDSTVLVLRFYPAGSQSDIGFVERAVTAVERLADSLAPATFHPALTVRLGGRFVQERLEARAIRDGVLRGGAVAVPLVLLVVLGYFGRRMGSLWRAPLAVLVVGVPLAMSLLWTHALVRLTVGSLNVVTVTLGVVLVGLGIDYGVHLLGAHLDARRDGHARADALAHAMARHGPAIALSAVTTAAAMLVLAFADFRGFREFGLLGGLGILLALLAMLAVLPALIALLDRRHWLVGATAGAVSAPHAAQTRPRGPAFVTAALLTVAALALLPSLRFEYHTSRLRPEFPEYQALRRDVATVFPTGGRSNPAYFLTDRPHEARALTRVLRDRVRADSGPPVVLAIEALQDRVPLTPAGQQARLARVARVRDRLAGPVLSRVSSAALDRLRVAAATTEPVTMDRLPAALAAPYRTRDGMLGNLVMVYPAQSLSDARNSMAFADAIGTVVTPDGRTHHAASMAIVAADMIRLMRAESPWLVAGSVGVIVLLLLAALRSPRRTFVALVPTLVGGVWMLGVMAALDVRLSFFNLAVLPIVVGVGNDAGVHLVSAPGRRTAERVLVAGLTTVCGFAGLLLTGHPGIISLGAAAVIGVAAILAASLLLVPALAPRA